MNEFAPAANLRPWRLVLRYALTGGVPRRSLSVALVVGSILNLINQGDRLVSGQSLDFLKLALTYCVPYFVSTYGAVSFRLYAARRPHGSMRAGMDRTELVRRCNATRDAEGRNMAEFGACRAVDRRLTSIG